MASSSSTSVAAGLGTHAPENPTYARSVRRETTPWWLWCNLLSLDAPLVAVVWAGLFARSAGARLSVVETFVLGLSVWCIYITDRLLDTRSVLGAANLQPRHHFCRRHSLTLTILLVSAALAILWLTMRGLPEFEFRAGVALGAILILYMATIHALPLELASAVPKELAVGFLFAAGTALPAWSHRASISADMLLCWIFFALLCSLNCMSIECWERLPQSRENGGDSQDVRGIVHWADSRIGIMAMAFSLVLIAGCWLINTSSDVKLTFFALSLAFLFIFFLNHARRVLSRSALRVLVDAAIFVPALLLFLLQNLRT
jgi:hypothetical protein